MPHPLAVVDRFCENKAAMKNYLLKYFFPGVVLIGCAFWVGTLPSMVFAFLGFLSFFLAGVALIIEGRKKQSINRGTQTADRKKHTTDKAS
jgi:hypothetical protein